jgi:hypothetical protein
MTVGGFGGLDPAPSLDQLTAAIHTGELRFVLLRHLTIGGAGAVPTVEFVGGPGGGTPGFSDARTTWISGNCTPLSIEGSTSSGLYDCAGA